MADKTIAIEIKVEGLDNVRLSTTELDKLAVVKAKNRKESQDTAKALTAEAGSMAALRAETSLLVAKLNNLGDATGKNAKQAKAYQDQIVQNKEKIRDFDRQLSGSSTLVGEYEKGFSGAFKKIGQSIGAIVAVAATFKGAWEGFKSVMESTEATSDTLAFTMERLHGGLQGMLRTVANGEWSKFFDNIDDGSKNAELLAKSFDLYNDALLSNNVLTAEETNQAYALEAIWRKTSNNLEERTNALNDWVKIKEAAVARELNIETVLNNQLVKDFTQRTGLTAQELKQYATLKGAHIEAVETLEKLNWNQNKLKEGIETGNIRKKEEVIWNDRINEQYKIATNLLAGSGISVTQALKLLNAETKLAPEEIEKLQQSYIGLAKSIAGNNQIQAETARARGFLENKEKKEQVKEEKKYIEESLLRWRTYFDEKNKLVTEQVRDVDFFGGEQQLKGKGANQIKVGKTSPDPEGDNLRKYVIRETKKNARERKAIELETEEEIAAQKKEINAAYLQAVGGLLNSYSSLLESNKQKELSSAGDNAKKRESIEREYRKKQQTAAYLQAVINAAQGITSIWARWGWNPPVAAILSGIEATATAIQLKVIASQKFAQGGLLQGRSHAQGGIPIRVNGQSGYEAEGGEAIINKRSTAKYRNLLSRINQEGGGKKFATGGLLPEQSNAMGFDFNLMSNLIANQINSIQVINNVGEFNKASNLHNKINTRQKV